MSQSALPLPVLDEAAHLFAPAPAENALILELENWEGPLDLLLDLARRQKAVSYTHLDVYKRQGL